MAFEPEKFSGLSRNGALFLFHGLTLKYRCWSNLIHKRGSRETIMAVKMTIKIIQEELIAYTYL